MKYLPLLLVIFSLVASAQKKVDVQVLDVKSRRSEDKLALDGKVRIAGDKP